MQRINSNFTGNIFTRKRGLLRSSVALFCAGIFATTASVALADESGTSFWLPGTYGSLSAVPGTPGWAVASVYYHTTVNAGADVAAAREIQIGRFSPSVTVSLNASLHATADLAVIVPSYTFATPVLGGQLAVQMGTIVGTTTANINGTVTASLPPFTVIRTANIGDTTTGVGDLYPLASLKWNMGVNNFMTYITGDIPVGDYSSTSVSNLGLGHGAIDAGGGYTYFNPATGREFSAVAGFTYNFMNPTTQYQSGVDFHLDWGASQFLSKQFFIGLVGYAYDQLTADSGAGDKLGAFESRVFSVGPQLGYIFPIAGKQGFLGLKSYFEFEAKNRPQGWNTWLTFAISDAPPAPASAASPPLIHK
ncbi:MAG: phenol degradation protein meta [Bradyrhizobium sp.]|uniref:SphA family protein n=1 Tax=Bradyrhizobium sp. TaxID=376 RepID=UPI0011F7EA1B|nr:transporter [Bradyrhizobium sp.]THD61918.1 MAG: phenol degradation protein meta [Bradyrhizobium sp.]